MGMAPAELPITEELPAFEMGGMGPVGQGPMSKTDRKMRDLENKRKMARTLNARNANLTPSQMAQFAAQEMAGQGAVSDAERAAAMGAMGQAATTPGGMGQASPQGPSSDTDSIIEGLKQLGKYAKGGCV